MIETHTSRDTIKLKGRLFMYCVSIEFSERKDGGKLFIDATVKAPEIYERMKSKSKQSRKVWVKRNGLMNLLEDN